MREILSSPVLLAKYMFIVLAAVLDVFGISAFIYLDKSPDNLLFFAVYAFLMFVEAALSLLCAYRITKSKRIYWLAVILLVVNIVSIFFDQIGVVSILFAIYNALLLFVLLVNRAVFTSPPANEE
jgi:hypothetical protein